MVSKLEGLEKKITWHDLSSHQVPGTENIRCGKAKEPRQSGRLEG
jgi:hypothetical protein